MNVVVDLADAVRAAVAAVDDPELPGVSIVELGLLEQLSVDADGAVSIGLIPTFSGCPALSLIKERVRLAAAAVEGVRTVDVTFLSAPAWSVDRISERARATARHRVDGGSRTRRACRVPALWNRDRRAVDVRSDAVPGDPPVSGVWRGDRGHAVTATR